MPLLCHGHLNKVKQKSGPNKAMSKLEMRLLVMHGDGALKTAQHH